MIDSPFAYGDGKPHDVGHERSLIKLLNALHDGKTLHQQPWMYSEGGASTSLIADGGSANYIACYVRPIFLGMDQLSTTVTRFLNVAPLVKPNGVFGVRVTLSQAFPSTSPGSQGVILMVTFRQPFAQVTWTYPASSSTWQLANPQSLPIGLCKDVDGWSYLTVELQGTGAMKGFSQLIESARSV